MAGSNWFCKLLLVNGIVFLIAGCAEKPESTRADSSPRDNTMAKSDREDAGADSVEMVVEPGVEKLRQKLELRPPIHAEAMASEAASDEEPVVAQPKKMATRQMRSFAHRAAPSNEEQMAVMSSAEVETDHPASQTTINVFYATDRKSKFGIATSDWVDVHFGALAALGFYLITFASVFISKRKVFFGVLAFASLSIFLVLGQSATVQWQKHKRLAANGDAIYISEIRPSSTDGLLDYGTCEVTIPPDHKIGHVDSPSLFKLEFTENPEKHVVLHRVIRSDSVDDFYAELNDSLSKSETRQGLIFVHGYNVSFDDAVKRTAQIAHDLEFEGAPICYSWTSHGALADYTKDMANADATVLALQSFLEETVRRTGNSTIHLVAHSMGNRALLQALDRIAVGSAGDGSEMFGQLVMAAPDVSAVDFKNRFAASAKELAKSITLYASSRDRALIASTEIHGHNRAGLAGDNLVVMDGVDTIDVSEIDTSLIGHSYYGDHPELIRDLRALVELAQPASNRNWLTRIPFPGSPDYFRFAEHLRSADETQPQRR